MEHEKQDVDTEQGPDEVVEASVEDFETDPARNPDDEDLDIVKGG
jgi:hypothetical protein